MKSPPIRERRRAPRLPVIGTGEIIRPETASARLVDVSVQGVLLAAARRFEPGERARVQTRLGGRVFQADMDIRHVEGTGPYRVGASFVALDAPTREALLQWLNDPRT